VWTGQPTVRVRRNAAFPVDIPGFSQRKGRWTSTARRSMDLWFIDVHGAM